MMFTPLSPGRCERIHCIMLGRALRKHIYRPIQSKGVCSKTEHKIAQFQNSELPIKAASWLKGHLQETNLECKLQHYMPYKL